MTFAVDIVSLNDNEVTLSGPNVSSHFPLVPLNERELTSSSECMQPFPTCVLC